MTRRVRIRYTGHAAQRSFWSSPAPYRAFVGGIGSGKTYAGAMQLLAMPPRSIGMVVAPTYSMLRDAALATFMEIAEPLVRSFNKSRSDMELTNGTRILWRTADRPDRLRGPNLGWAWIDEAAYCKPSVWDVLIGRLRHPLGPHRMWITTTPKGRDWIWRRFHPDGWAASDRTGAGYALVQCASRDNRFLPEGYVDTVAQDYTSAFALQELEGQFVEFSGGVFEPAWFRYADRAPEGLVWSRYWDLAASTAERADYTASVRVARDGATVYVADGIHLKAPWPTVRARILATAEAEPDTRHVGVEAQGFQLAAVDDLKTHPALAPRLRPVTVHRDKITRALPLAAAAERGEVVVVRGSWSAAAIAEVCAAPEGEHDDWLDALSGAWAMSRPSPPLKPPVPSPPAMPRFQSW